jgi:hypothetical protein
MDKDPNELEVDHDGQESGDEATNPNQASDEPQAGEKIKGFDTPATTPAEHQGDARRITM